MTDMTMGQRIADQRKKLGLSQEALGEKMGVSRQAISKWEADGAVPEIDKLIVLSRLFGVSVGWLLGVEDAPVSTEQADTLSDEQLYLIEEIIKKYQPKPANRKILLAGILCTVLMVASILFIGIRQGNLFARVASGETELDSLWAQVNYSQAVFESRLDAAQTAQNPATALLAEHHMEILTSAVDGPAAQIGFSAMPNKWQDGDRGFLFIRQAGMETMQLECKWDGAFLTADTILDVENGYEFCFTLLHADGTQEQQVVTDPEIENLKKTLAVTVEILSVGYNTKTTPLKIENFEYSVTMPSAAHYGDLSWKSIELILATAGGEELGRCLLLDADRKTDSELLLSSSLHSVHTEIIFENLQLPKNEGIQLWLRTELSNGLSTETIVVTWVVSEDGTLRSQ